MKAKTLAYLIIISLLSFSFTNNREYENIEGLELFKIERSRDADEISYSLNIDSCGKLNADNPIKVFWVKNTKSGQVEPLTWIQKKYAYGVRYLKTNNANSKFCFVSYPEREFTLKLTNLGYKVFTISDNQEIEVNKIFIQFNGGTFWIPVITKVELQGVQVSNNAIKIEIIKP